MYRQSYLDDPELLGRVFELLETAFPGIGAHVEAAGVLGLDWGKTSTPFVRIEGGQIVSHVGVLALPLIIDGKEVSAAGIHAVCTHPDYRKRGYYRAVMSEAVEWWEQHFETAVLFTDSPGLYEPFGFRVVPESYFVVSEVASGPSRTPIADSEGYLRHTEAITPNRRNGMGHPQQRGLRRLDWSCRDDVALLRRLVRERQPVSNRLGVASEEAVFAFNAVNMPMWYAEELDTIICFKQEGQTVRIFDVVASKLPTWAELAEYLPAGTDRVEIYFCPDGLGLESSAGPCAVSGDDVIMVRGPFVPDSQPKMFPRTAEC